MTPTYLNIKKYRASKQLIRIIIHLTICGECLIQFKIMNKRSL